MKRVGKSGWRPRSLCPWKDLLIHQKRTIKDFFFLLTTMHSFGLPWEARQNVCITFSFSSLLGAQEIDLKKSFGWYLSLKLLMEMSRTSPGFPRKIKVHPWLFKLKELELTTPVRLSLALNSCTHWLVGSLLLLIPPEFIGFLPPRLRVVRWLPSKKWTFYWSLCEGHYSQSCFFPR